MSVTRRDFVKLAGAATVATSALAVNPATAAASRRRRRQPNIVFLMVDELRFPRHFPGGITSSREFLGRYMPNVAALWDRGVKFNNHYTAATSCGPARAALVTGLYPHQQWNLITPPGDPTPGASLAPALLTGFPTYGKLMRRAGYRTPYVGKWHLCASPAAPGDPGSADYLEDYGFRGYTIPDVTGLPGQGMEEDPIMAGQAVHWLRRQKKGAKPFCLTVSLVNPHDKQFFWSGTEASLYRRLYEREGATPLINFEPYPGEGKPRDYGYSALPRNWESAKQLAANKPGCQTFTREFSALVYGDAAERPTDKFSFRDFPGISSFKIAVAPFEYWRKSQDCYTQVMEMVDKEIGRVVRAIPRELRDDTIIILTSDHGEYAGAHGMLSGKEGTVYEECMKVPLIVVDPRGEYTGDEDIVRRGLTSSVDLLPLMVTIGHGGSREWMKGDYRAAYGDHLDLLPVLKRRSGRTRKYVWMSSDEMHAQSLNVGNAPRHVLGVRTEELKVASYTHWTEDGRRLKGGRELESYDYDTPGGRWELDNFQCESGAARDLLRIMNKERRMAAPLPPRWQATSQRAKQIYLDFIKSIK